MSRSLADVQALFAEMQAEVHQCNVAHGWFDEHRTMGDNVALLHSEASEILEEYRLGRMLTEIEEHGKPVGVPSEAADVLIRLFDFCQRYDIDLAAEFETKLAFNWTRPIRHGGKAL